MGLTVGMQDSWDLLRTVCMVMSDLMVRRESEKKGVAADRDIHNS